MIHDFISNKYSQNESIKLKFDNALLIGDEIVKNHPEVDQSFVMGAILVFTFNSEKEAFEVFKNELNNKFYPEFMSYVFIKTTELIDNYTQLKSSSVKSLMLLLETYSCKFSLLLLKYHIKYPVPSLNSSISSIKVVKKSSHYLNDDIYLKVIDITLKKLLNS
jgi:hypothetical protein